MDIIQIIPANQAHGVLGLADDNKIYEWSFLKGSWIEYSKAGNQAHKQSLENQGYYEIRIPPGGDLRSHIPKLKEE